MTQPVNPIDYGTTLSCVGDLDPMGQTVNGLTAVSQALVRRLLTPRGRLLNDPNYGYDLAGELNDDVTPQQVGRIAADIDTEFLKDQRVFSSVTTVTLAADGQLDVSSQITTATGPFTLVLQVSQVTVTLLQGP